MLKNIKIVLSVAVLLSFIISNSFSAVSLSQPITNAEFANMLIGAVGLPMPEASDQLSDREFFEVQANMLAESNVTFKFLDAEPNKIVTRGEMASILYEAIQKSTTFNPEWGYGNMVNVVSVTGNATVIPDIDGKPVQCRKNMFVIKGSRIKTGDDSTVELSFDLNKKNIFKIKANTDVFINLTDDNKIELIDGALVTFVKDLKEGSDFVVRTPNAVCSARGTGWETTSEGENTDVSVFDEEVYARGIKKDGTPMSKVFLVKKGFSRKIKRFSNPGGSEKLPEMKLFQLNREVKAKSGKPNISDIIRFFNSLGLLSKGDKSDKMKFSDAVNALNNPALANEIAEAYRKPPKDKRNRGNRPPGVVKETPVSPI